MGLLSFFKRKDESPAGDTPAADAVAQARIRARRRLIGATVLLGIGVIGFPLLFETQPRPIPVDIPIEIPRKESAPPLALPSARAPAAVVAEPPVAAAPAPSPAPAPAPAADSTPRAAAPVITERAADQGREVASPAPAPSARATAAPASTPAARTAAAAASAARTAAVPASAAARSTTEAQRAQALLEGRNTAPKAASQPASARLVVQVGAYTDADKLRDARQKVEKLGMKTYTQVVEADGAKRTRVRVGPFATREEADKAAARIKAAGLPVAILTL